LLSKILLKHSLKFFWCYREGVEGEREGRRAGRMDKVPVPGGREEKGEEKK
jgi:hypothetical protein